ncbi:unnamed protein product [Phytophthora lilii]|uniref:beta-glucosidase n=1 Tax=Phytophthora lilii TaxID=2077276 RepID=A0A9W6WRB0_9STRA|nr:unnamed protein product [Phytophthora lilii]
MIELILNFAFSKERAPAKLKNIDQVVDRSGGLHDSGLSSSPKRALRFGGPVGRTRRCDHGEVHHGRYYRPDELVINMVLADDNQIDEDKVREYAKLRLGSYLSSPFSTGLSNGSYIWTVDEWRERITKIQEITMEENGGHPMVYGVDSVHGAIFIKDAVLFVWSADQRRQGTISAVENYISIIGVPTIANGKIMNALLRDDLGYDGMMVTDYAEIEELATFHRTARNATEAAQISFKHTSNDMSMGYHDQDHLYTHGVTVKSRIEQVVGNSTVNFFNGLHPNGSYSEADLATAKEMTAKAEYTIAVIGEETYAEKPGDIDDLALPAGQIEYVKELASTGTKVIVVLFEGRPRLLGEIPENRTRMSVDVTNSGRVAGKETVMLFMIQPYRSLNVPEMKLLKKFSKISLEPGETKTVNFTLTADDWSVYYLQIGHGLKKIAEDSDSVVAIKPETDCDVYNETAAANPLCATFTLSTGEHPFGSFEQPW